MEIGERSLELLLRGMDPVLDAREYVFATGTVPEGMEVLCRFREDEGVSSILAREDAERAAIPFTYPCRRITLRIHSSLYAVGFLARIAAELARHEISVNVVSAYHHDHLFVAAEHAPEAMAVLRTLAGNGQGLPQDE